MIIDAHFHSWELARGDYGWLTPQLRPIYRDVGVADWLAQAAPCGVQGGVLVQAAPTQAETEHLLRLAQAHPQVLGVVGWIDFLAPDAAQRIGRLAAQPALKGLRPMLQDIDDVAWILQPGVEPALQAMVDHALVFDALIQPRHLPVLLQLVRRWPGLSMVVDHGAKPDIARGQWEPWASGLVELARCPSVACKLSGLLTEAGPAPDPASVGPWAGWVLQTFGPHRVMWGSDWPVLELASDYAAWWQQTQTVLSGLDAASRALVLGGTAQRVYRL